MVARSELDGFDGFTVDNGDEAVPFFDDFGEVGLHFGVFAVGDKINGAEQVEISVADKRVYAEFEPV